ncbi:MAG: hypothetical protein KF845_03420 [Cyclobacteriaceae bacterium]|nr:hypothetical protein [Cyclobacteriaceae bacterium]
MSFLRFNNKNWKAILLCVFAATIFWAFNSLNKHYSASINFPLAFDYDQENYIPVRPLPEQVKINVSGLGWELFRKSIGLKVLPLRIPLENPADVRKIVGASLPPLFSGQMEGLQINFILTDTLHIQVDPKTRRRVFVTVDSVEQYLRSGFGLSGSVTISPDTVWLEGPQSLVSSLPETLTIRPDFKNIDASVNERLEVDLFSNLIRVNPQTVTIRFPVSRMIQITDSVEVQVVNAASGLKTVPDISKIRYQYAIPEDQQNTSVSTQAILDLQGIGEGEHKLVPKLVNLPPFARHVVVDTLHISF